MKLIAFQPDCISKSVVFVCVVFVVFQSSRWKYLQDDGNLQSLKLCFFINKKKGWYEFIMMQILCQFQPLEN